MPNLFPLEPVQLGSGLFYVDHHRPVGLWTDGRVSSFVSWSDAAIPSLAFSASLFPSARGVWIEYSPHAIDVRATPDHERTAAYVEPDGLKRSVRLGDTGAIGSDAYGLWVSEPQRVVWSDEYLGGTLPAQWHVALTRHNVDGSETTATFDRPVQSISSAPGGTRIAFYPTPPLAIPMGHGGIQYKYRVASIDVPENLLSGSNLAAADFEWAPVTDDLYGEQHGDDLRSSFARERLLDRPEIPGDLSAEWPMLDRSEVDVEAVVAEALQQFSWYAGMNHDADDRVSNTAVELRGEWPELDLVVYFDYSAFPGPRFRYVLPLFEQGGRPALSTYASDNFREDLATKKFLPPIAPVGEFIDF